MVHTIEDATSDVSAPPAMDTLADSLNGQLRHVILVTGAPRTATTPVGNMLALAGKTTTIYEPFGPTGFREIQQRFPMTAGEGGLSPELLGTLIGKIASFRGALNSQRRENNKLTSKTAIFGTRTKHSLRMARLQPWLKTVIWKDPHAIMLTPDLVRAGMPVVVTARRAKAHAGSYKRLGWHSRAAEIYPRWQERFGRDALVEAWLEKVGDPVVSAALIWRMSYLPLVREGCVEKVHFVTADALEADEEAIYRQLYDKLGLTPTRKFEAELNSRAKASGNAIPGSGATHDWTRSVEVVNAYWKKLLSEDEIVAVDTLTGELEALLFL